MKIVLNYFKYSNPFLVKLIFDLVFLLEFYKVIMIMNIFLILLNNL